MLRALDLDDLAVLVLASPRGFGDLDDAQSDLRRAAILARSQDRADEIFVRVHPVFGLDHFVNRLLEAFLIGQLAVAIADRTVGAVDREVFVPARRVADDRNRAQLA